MGGPSGAELCPAFLGTGIPLSLMTGGGIKHPGLEPQRDLAHFAVSEQGKARPEAKASEAIPGHHHQPREEEMLQSGGP